MIINFRRRLNRKYLCVRTVHGAALDALLPLTSAGNAFAELPPLAASLKAAIEDDTVKPFECLMTVTTQ